jgi:hypothetical protein
MSCSCGTSSTLKSSLDMAVLNSLQAYWGYMACSLDRAVPQVETSAGVYLTSGMGVPLQQQQQQQHQAAAADALNVTARLPTCRFANDSVAWPVHCGLCLSSSWVCLATGCAYQPLVTVTVTIAILAAAAPSPGSHTLKLRAMSAIIMRRALYSSSRKPWGVKGR